MNRKIMLRLLFVILVVSTICITITSAGRNSETKRDREDIVKEEYEKKLDEQEVKHQKTIEAAAEIEDSLRAEVKRLKENKNSMGEYVKYVGEKASEVADITTKTLKDATETTQEYLGTIKDSTAEAYEETLKPAVEQLKKNAEDFVEPHAKKYAPMAKSYMEKIKKWMEKFSDKAQYLFMYYRQEAIETLSNQDNISHEGAAYIVDLFLFTIIFAIVFYAGFYVAIPAMSKLFYLGTCCHCFNCLCCCFGLCGSYSDDDDSDKRKTFRQKRKK
jgi:hypothetical protein